MKSGPLHIGILCAVIFTVLAFSPGKDPEPTTVKPGIYSLCGVDSAERTIELKLRMDSTFRYYNVSYPNGTADVDGKWKVEKGAVILYDYKKDIAIHNRWKIEENGCLKSIKPVGAAGGLGLLMFRIQHVDNCPK